MASYSIPLTAPSALSFSNRLTTSGGPAETVYDDVDPITIVSQLRKLAESTGALGQTTVVPASSSTGPLVEVVQSGTFAWLSLRRKPHNVEALIAALNTAFNEVENSTGTGSAAIKHILLADTSARVNGSDNMFFDTAVHEVECTAVERQRQYEEKERLFKRMQSLKPTVVALVKGSAFGFGAELVAVAGVAIIQTRNVSVGFPDIVSGVMPSYTAISCLRKKMGFRRCAEVTRSLHERTYEDYLELGILTAVDWNFSERDIGSSKKLLLPEPLQPSNESRILDMMPPSSIKAYLLCLLYTSPSPRDS
eukprot:TRINITY_DN21065_c0_g1_i1.p1 TRINITY_DN21065_c0_g1~~TRINITY_DN21065_c0_g1_i1.p1  ORF type:complete len:308 (+),score=68.44 TRINITY_DN21065_c0_g1_i1:349-1272(+)